MKKSLKKLTVSICAMALVGLAGCATQTSSTTSQQLPAANASVFNQTQQQAISNIVAQTLIQNPTILLQSIEALKAEQQKAMTEQASVKVQQVAGELIGDPLTPSIGPRNASVVVVEFFDYQCAYCHQVFPGLQSLVSANPNVRFVFKELPFFGEPSVYAAQVSLVAYQQGKFEAFHNALFATNLMEGQLTDKAVDKIASQTGVNLGKNKVLLNQPFIQQEISGTRNLASQLQINGTPGFIVMPNSAMPDASKISFIPGAVPQQALIQAITNAQPSAF